MASDFVSFVEIVSIKVHNAASGHARTGTATACRCQWDALDQRAILIAHNQLEVGTEWLGHPHELRWRGRGGTLARAPCNACSHHIIAHELSSLSACPDLYAASTENSSHRTSRYVGMPRLTLSLLSVRNTPCLSNWGAYTLYTISLHFLPLKLPAKRLHMGSNGSALPSCLRSAIIDWYSSSTFFW
eukprot:3596603-Prymnesium_polylepis.1